MATNTLIAQLKQRLRPYPQFVAMRSVYWTLRQNIAFLRHVAREGLCLRLLLPSPYSNTYARQQVLTWSLPTMRLTAPHDVTAWLRREAIALSQGRNTIYLPPQERLAHLLPHTQTYPPGAGFKILKRVGPPATARYLSDDSHIRARSRLIGRAQDQLVTANYMHALGIGPRAWDVACWRAGDTAYTVFVVDHVAGRSPTDPECQLFVGHLRDLVSRTHLRIVLPDWQRTGDFRGPDCNHNLVVSATTGRPQYVDFQNFCISTPSAWTTEVLASAKPVLHFGEGRLFRGSRYLYQSVPGLGSAGKRDTETRWQRLSGTLRDAGLDLRGRVVLDVGCNAGMMLHGALVAGARWALGWDRAPLVRHAEDLLLSLGATRFHLYGADLHPSYPLQDDIPSHLRPALSEAVVLYLSVRQHVGLLHSLQQIPWRALLYEGHQGEHLTDLPRILAPLLQNGVRCVSTSLVADGDCLARPVALLLRGDGTGIDHSAPAAVANVS